MKRYFTTLLAVLASCSIATAQDKAQEIMGATVDIQRFEYQDDSVKMDIRYNLENLDISSSQSIIFSPKLFTEQKTIALPTLVVKRRGAERSYKRAMALGNKKSTDTYQRIYGTPDQVIEFFGSEKPSEAFSSITIPYEPWMKESNIYFDYTTYGCCNEREDMLIPDNNSLAINYPEVMFYDYVPQVALQKPEKVAVKRKNIEYSSALIFRVNSVYIDPNLGSNKAEIESIDTMMQSVISDSDYTITKVNIAGFASPEGTLASNMRLSKGRAAALEYLMKQKYRMIKPNLYNVEFGGENWGKLSEIVKAGDFSWRDEVLDIIDSYTIEEGREAKLMTLQGGAPYKYLLHNVFPDTRLVVINVEFNIDAYDIVRISELIDTKPENLSLEEMYRLSENYTIEDAMFEKIFMTAIEQYPGDAVAQNNALAMEIQRGDISSLEKIAASVDKSTTSAELANSLAAYYHLAGEYDLAKQMYTRAIELGSDKAKENMKGLEGELKAIKMLEESKAFQAKIDGK